MAGQFGPGKGGGPEGRRQLRSAGFDQPVGRLQRTDQGGELERRRLAPQQGPGEGHAFSLAVGGANTGMKAAHARTKTFAGLGISGVGMGGDRRSSGGGHGREWATGEGRKTLQQTL